MQQKMTCLLLALVFWPVASWAVDMTPDPIGTWRFKNDDKQVKIVVLGGSIAAAHVNFSKFLGAACRHIEVKNKARIGFGAPQLRSRFTRQVTKNRRIKPDFERFEYWLLYNGGLNSVGYPEGSIRAMARTFAKAHAFGMKVVAMSVTPWGSNRAKKWQWWQGLARHRKTRMLVNFVMGELSRALALGRLAGPEPREWQAEELPDLGVNLYDGALRDTQADLRDRDKLMHRYGRSKALRRLYPDVEQVIDRAMAVPRWFLNDTIRGFDHTHPNREGQKIMALETCPKLPASWGCDCKALESLVWRKGKVVPE